MRVSLVVAVLLSACTTAADFTAAPYDRRSGDTAWRLDEDPQGFTVSVRQDLYRFIPDAAGTEASCRREAVALALVEARRRGRVDARVDERLVRSSFGRNGVSGVSTCTAVATVNLQ
jgi:hypothetical protein